jgi:hypothetical protein
VPSHSDCYFYNCSRQYIDQIDAGLYDQVLSTVGNTPRLGTQSEVNAYLFRQFVPERWSYDAKPQLVEDACKDESLNRELCLSSTTLDARWRCDFAKSFTGGLVQVEVQFGTVESMFKDFCGFQIAYAERRLVLGIEIVMSNPNEYFSHRKKAISGMAYFRVAKETLPSLNFDCPIWLIGMGTPSTE